MISFLKKFCYTMFFIGYFELAKTVFKTVFYALKIKNGFLNDFNKTTVFSLKQINIIVITKRKLVSVLF